METNNQTLGLVFANYGLTTALIYLLKGKGVISDLEARELVEHSLWNLEVHQSLADPSLQPAVELARENLEELRQNLDDTSQL